MPSWFERGQRSMSRQGCDDRKITATQISTWSHNMEVSKFVKDRTKFWLKPIFVCLSELSHSDIQGFSSQATPQIFTSAGKKKKKKNAVVAGLEYKAKAPFEFVSGWSHLANIRITIVLVKYKWDATICVCFSKLYRQSDNLIGN